MMDDTIFIEDILTIHNSSRCINSMDYSRKSTKKSEWAIPCSDSNKHNRMGKLKAKELVKQIEYMNAGKQDFSSYVLLAGTIMPT